jgi:formamidopyrimidine-DNA glycosylase
MRVMPEGDTIWRAARTLHRALAGETVLAARSTGARSTRTCG